jgi:uncharacterized membrane protein (DUF106 family)
VLDWLNHLVLAVMDCVVGWLLLLPRDATLAALALLTSLLFVAVRRYSTNQDLLLRCAADHRRLRELMRDARRRRDTPELTRLRGLRGLVGRKAFAQEGKPLLILLLPLVLLGTWAWQRLEFLPAKAGAPVTFTATFPISAAGQFVHLVPAPGLQAPDGWIRQLTVTTNAGVATAVASWTLTGERGSYTLTLRRQGRTLMHPLLLGERRSSAPSLVHDDGDVRTIVELKQARWLDMVPGVPQLGLAPWLVAYLALVLVITPALKRSLRIC